jgi:hypothetical protein
MNNAPLAAEMPGAMPGQSVQADGGSLGEGGGRPADHAAEVTGVL